MIRIDDLVAKASAYLPRDADPSLIRKAYVYSATLHRERFFPGGAPYLQHALEVGYILAEMRLDLGSIVAGLLHDVLEEGLADADALRDSMGGDVADLVEELSKLARASYRGSEASRAENMRQMILASTRDIRVILILLADRLQLMRSLEQLEPHDREALARETLHIYSPLAHRLGIFYALAEMEDLAFHALEPEHARALRERVEARLAVRRASIERINAEISALLERHGLQGEVVGRTKHLYSLHRKLQRNQVALDEVYDLLATRIILHSEEECYRALGLIHAAYTPLPGRFKDYIALPKENGYQSLHTTVFGSHGEMVEIQIRTREMHRTAELGVAAHFLYKRGARQTDSRELANLSWFRGLLENLEAGQDPQESMDLLRRDLVPGEIFVFTPAGEVIKLPAQATAIDFAYAIHTDVGHRCSGAKVDGRMAPIRRPLPNGAVVEIVTTSRAAPRKDWLKFAVTSKALSRIRGYLRQRDKAEAARRGREQVARAARRFGKKPEALLEMAEMREWMRRHGLNTAEDLYAAEAYGRHPIREVLEKLLASRERPPARPRAVPAARPAAEGAEPVARRVRVAGMDHLMVRFARCCEPQPGDPVLGIVSRGHGVSVHHRDCRNVAGLRRHRERTVEVEWAVERGRNVTLLVSTASSMKALIRVAELLEEEGTPLQSGAISLQRGEYTQRLTVRVQDAAQLERMLQRLNAMADIRAERELESA